MISHIDVPYRWALMAVQDGYLIARCIEHDGDNLKLALARYEEARIERTTRIVLRSTENGRRFHHPALASPEGAAAYVDREWVEDKVRERYDCLFRYNVDAVAV